MTAQAGPLLLRTRRHFFQDCALGLGSLALAPWVARPRPPEGTPEGQIWSGVISYAMVYRTSSEGPHVELALNPVLAVNSRVLATDPRFSLQVNGQVTFADLWAPWRFHLISPFITGGVALNMRPGITVGAGFAVGNQVSFDIIRDRLQIYALGGVAGVWTGIGTPGSLFSVGWLTGLGITVTLPSLSR